MIWYAKLHHFHRNKLELYYISIDRHQVPAVTVTIWCDTQPS